MAGTVDNVTSHGALLDETLALVRDARTYLHAATARHTPPADDMLLAEACELSRLSARVSYCLAWLLTREAVRRGLREPPGGSNGTQRLALSSFEGQSQPSLAGSGSEIAQLREEVARLKTERDAYRTSLFALTR
ncbi:MAG: DUF1465 family protein, partial [Rhodospirillales bacterium]|nr:DUF1465 family protein [Rhodospirillales bacterium]